MLTFGLFAVLIVVFWLIFVLILLVDVFIINPLESWMQEILYPQLKPAGQILGTLDMGFDNNYRKQNSFATQTMFCTAPWQELDFTKCAPII